MTKIRRSVRTYRTCPNFGKLRYAGEGRGTLMWVITAKPSIPELKRGGEGWYGGGPATPSRYAGEGRGTLMWFITAKP